MKNIQLIENKQRKYQLESVAKTGVMASASKM